MSGSDFEQKVRLLMQKKGLSLVDVASSLDISRQYMYDLFKMPSIPISHAVAIDGLLNSEHNNHLNLYIVPIKAQGGFLKGYNEKATLDRLEKRHYPEINGECFAFEIEGLSMYLYRILDGVLYESGYAPGSQVITTKLESPDELMSGRDYVFQTINGINLKTFVKIQDGKCLVKSLNPEYAPFEVPLNEIKGIYFVEHYDKKVN